MVTAKRPDTIDNAGPLLAAMRTCRQTMINASMAVKPMGATYHGLGMVVSALDALATLLTGRQDYFWATSGGAAEGQSRQIAADAAMEAGHGADESHSKRRQP
jgi:hypothetical protein